MIEQFFGQTFVIVVGVCGGFVAMVWIAYLGSTAEIREEAKRATQAGSLERLIEERDYLRKRLEKIESERPKSSSDYRKAAS